MKIIHISDLHFGDHLSSLIPPFLKELQEIKPDVVLISGDLTQRARSQQFQLLVDFLKQIKSTILVVPGNHDIPLYNVFRRFLLPFRTYNHYIASKYASKLQNESVRILGLNTVDPFQAKDGKLTRKALNQIESYFSPAFNGLNILFFHHNFDYLEGLHKPLHQYRQLLSYLKKSPVHIVCTGHLHYANVSLIEKENHASCVLLHAGSLLSQRSRDHLHSFFVIEAQPAGCKIDWRVYKENSFHSHTQYSIDFSKKYSVLKSEMTAL